MLHTHRIQLFYFYIHSYLSDGLHHLFFHSFILFFALAYLILITTFVFIEGVERAWGGGGGGKIGSARAMSLEFGSNQQVQQVKMSGQTQVNLRAQIGQRIGLIWQNVRELCCCLDKDWSKSGQMSGQNSQTLCPNLVVELYPGYECFIW